MCFLKPLRVKKETSQQEEEEKADRQQGASRKRKDAGWREYVFHAAGKKP
ncbi:hypothetical protein LNP74_34295 [Klebsiella pneumoniae subsp. pneumoniae]|nr:hypothetical protein [Klebsiella pneumoniae subsp. pneumoniae]